MQGALFSGNRAASETITLRKRHALWFLQSLPLEREVIHLVTTVIVPKSRANRKQLLQTGVYTNDRAVNERSGDVSPTTGIVSELPTIRKLKLSAVPGAWSLTGC
jgi:hypothetical protein